MLLHFCGSPAISTRVRPETSLFSVEEALTGCLVLTLAAVQCQMPRVCHEGLHYVMFPVQPLPPPGRLKKSAAPVCSHTIGRWCCGWNHVDTILIGLRITAEGATARYALPGQCLD